jgi:poly [ADP-ribose] polymerase
MMKQQMTQIGYNVKKMPLGQLTKQHIQKGYGILQKLMDELRGRKDRRNIEHFTN